MTECKLEKIFNVGYLNGFSNRSIWAARNISVCYTGNNNMEFIFNSETFVKATFVAKINVDSE